MITTILSFLAFSLIHSITVANGFKQRCHALFGDTFMRVWYRFLYTLASAATVGAALFCIASAPDRALAAAPPWLYWIMRGIQTAGLALGVRAFEHLDAGEFLGVRQVMRYVRERRIAGNIEGLTGTGLITTGVYGIVRHPLYLCGMLIVTFDPVITLNGLTFTVLADAYFLFGIFMEESRFQAAFGEEYRNYAQRVPMLVPRLFRSGRR